MIPDADFIARTNSAPYRVGGWVKSIPLCQNDEKYAGFEQEYD